MIGNKKVFGLIQVRENSQRIPGKNMQILNGKPLPMWVLNEAKKCKHDDGSNYFDDIYVSTSSKNYQRIFLDWGCKIIFRPSELSCSNVPNLEVYKHAINFIPCHDDDYIVHLDICKPLTKALTMKMIIGCADDNNLDSCYTVKKFRHTLVGQSAIPTHQLEEVYVNFGAVRLLTKETIEKAEIGTWGKGENHIDLPIIKDYEIDIDYMHDLAIAEFLMSVPEYYFNRYE